MCFFQTVESIDICGQMQGVKSKSVRTHTGKVLGCCSSAILPWTDLLQLWDDSRPLGDRGHRCHGGHRCDGTEGGRACPQPRRAMLEVTWCCCCGILGAFVQSDAAFLGHIQSCCCCCSSLTRCCKITAALATETTPTLISRHQVHLDRGTRDNN